MLNLVQLYRIVLVAIYELEHEFSLKKAVA